MKAVQLEVIQSVQKENNIERLGEYSDTCICCGKRTNNNQKSIQLLTNGFLVDTEIELKNSQGYFMIGKDCLKKFNLNACEHDKEYLENN